MTQPYPYYDPLKVRLHIVDDNNNNITAKVSGFKFYNNSNNTSSGLTLSSYDVNGKGRFHMIVRPVGINSENLKFFFQPEGEFGTGGGSISIQY